MRDGYILTNYHVIEGSRSVQVKVGSREYTAAVVESLPAQDLALLKVEARGLPVVALGNSDLLQVGDDVFAIGCPGGICGTVTAGRVANIGVTITVESGKKLQGMLMVDITTDPGSSGGPLVNSRGEVVGVTTAGQRGSFGFSIPISQAIPLLRRVPGFDVGQMGRATTELPFRAIRDRITPVTAFILTDQGTALRLPPRYDNSKWPRASGGRVCRTWIDPFVSPFCYLDRYVPPGWRLVGFEYGFADSQEWTRVFPSHSSKPVSFGQGAFVWILQFESSAAATAAAAAYCCPENMAFGGGWWAFGGCSTCVRDRTLLVSTKSATGPLSVMRWVVSHKYGDKEGLAYSMIATLDSYLVLLVVNAWLSSQDFFLLVFPCQERGLVLQRSIFAGGSVAHPHVVMTYSAFIDWATAREKELLEFILAQL